MGLLETVRSEIAASAPTTTTATAADSGDVALTAGLWHGWPKGHRNAGLTSAAGLLRSKGLDAHIIEPFLLAVNRSTAMNLPDSEVQAIAQSIGRYAAPVRGVAFIPSWDNQPAESTPLATLAGVKILSRGNMAGLTAGAGAGKSAVIEATCASAIREGAGIGIALETGVSVALIDSERSTTDHHRSWRRFTHRSGIKPGEAIPGNVRWFNIRGMAALSERVEFLFSILENNPPDVTLIDGIGDFVADPNNSGECTDLLNRIGAALHNHQTGAILTLHNNPVTSKEKARGVLGSELWRKVEALMLIDKTTDKTIRRITTDYSLGKVRNAPDIVEAFFQWNDEAEMHLPCEGPTKSTGKVATEVDSIFRDLSGKSWAHTDIVRLITTKYHRCKRTAVERVTTMVDSGVLIHNEDGTYSTKKQETTGYIHD
jgi:hypothetical protein